jgi:hypothetical protein
MGPSGVGGEWSERLVPAGEVESAFREGWKACRGNFSHFMLDEQNDDFDMSRARQISTGEVDA